MDTLGRSWLHYGIHAISKKTVGSGVLVVFPESEFKPHLHDSSSLLTSPLGILKIMGLVLSPFQTL
jgi:hypothetical protein